MAVQFLLTMLEQVFTFVILWLILLTDGAAYRDIRLTGSSRQSPQKGTLNILKGDNWGTVCDLDWNEINSDVACRHLGYPNASVMPSEEEIRRGRRDGLEIVMGDVRCNGSEDEIWDCPHSKQPVDCTNGRDVALACNIPGYLGCYGNNVSDWVLNAGHYRSTALTIKSCLEFCRRDGFPFAGLENGDDCYCGYDTDDFDRLGRFPDQTCSIPCSGNRQEACGGTEQISVYNVSHSFCKELDAPPGGWYKGDSTFFGQTLEFGCNNDVELIGNDVIQCIIGSKGVRWSAHTPYCFGVTAASPNVNVNNPSSGKSLLRENAIIIWSIAGVAGVLLIGTIITVTFGIRSMNRKRRDPDANSIDFDLEPAGVTGTYRHSIHSLYLLDQDNLNTEEPEKPVTGNNAMYLREEVKGCVGMQTNALSFGRNKSQEDLEWDEDLDSGIDRRTSTVEYVNRTIL